MANLKKKFDYRIHFYESSGIEFLENLITKIEKKCVNFDQK